VRAIVIVAGERYAQCCHVEVRVVAASDWSTHFGLYPLFGVEGDGYFLIVRDIVEFARSQGILCLGRGSAAASLVCYAVGITAIDVMRLRLPFERFLSMTRDEEPDIDVDFDSDRREEVIQWVYEKYGVAMPPRTAGVTGEVVWGVGRGVADVDGARLGWRCRSSVVVAEPGAGFGDGVEHVAVVGVELDHPQGVGCGGEDGRHVDVSLAGGCLVLECRL